MQNRTTALFAVITAFAVHAQAPAPVAPARRAGPRSAFPTRPPADPAVVERGKALYGVQCNFCHGSDARGGEGGPNLLRSQLVLNDIDGELIAPVVHNGRGEMPKFNLTDAQIADIAAYIHSFRVGGYDISRMKPPSIVVGDPKAGQMYFAETCGSCHSVTGDLKGLAARITDPMQLQQSWLMPGVSRGFGGQPPIKPPEVTATVTLDGKALNGRLQRIDDFTVTIVDADGAQRTFTRQSATQPKVEMHDPLKPHKDLLAKYTDKDIHDVTAYLETVK